MKFKTILLTSLMIGLNLCAYEPLTPSKASEKAYIVSMGRLIQGYGAMQTMVPTLLPLVLSAMTIKRNINLKSTL